VDFALDGAFHGSDSTRVYPDDQQYTRIRLQPGHSSATADSPAAATPDGLLRGQLSIHSGREGGSLPILFVPPLENGNAHYQNDFDRDGSPGWVLESERLRLIVSPADAGQALALVDKSTNENLITLGGALHDLLTTSGDTAARSRASADFSANAAYRAAWIEQEQGTSLQLTYSAHEHSMAGLHVEKTLRLPTPETVEAAYRISLGAIGTDVSAGNIDPAQIFISRLSVPAYSPAQAEDGQTSFCWQPAASTVSVASAAVPAKAAPDLHCEEFVASGPPIAIPSGIARLEIRTPNRHVLAVEWTSAQATIVPKNFSAQLEFAIPAPPPGAVPAEFILRYTVGDLQP
jgi:hypothetical protein